MQTKQEPETFKPFRFEAKLSKRFAVSSKVWQKDYFLHYMLRFMNKCGCEHMEPVGLSQFLVSHLLSNF